MKAVIIGLSVATLLLTGGCKSGTQANKQAKQGAAYGALGGATSGFLRGLFRGDPLGRAAEGAVVGAGTGAVVGGAHGASADKQLKKEVGTENYDAVLALIKRDYRTARQLVDQVPADAEPRAVLTAAWVSALVNYETAQDEAYEADCKKLIELIPEVTNQKELNAEIKRVKRELKQQRKKHGMG